jgi:hypothetical protein
LQSGNGKRLHSNVDSMDFRRQAWDSHSVSPPQGRNGPNCNAMLRSKDRDMILEAQNINTVKTRQVLPKFDDQMNQKDLQSPQNRTTGIKLRKTSNTVEKCNNIFAAEPP